MLKFRYVKDITILPRNICKKKCVASMKYVSPLIWIVIWVE